MAWIQENMEDLCCCVIIPIFFPFLSLLKPIKLYAGINLHSRINWFGIIDEEDLTIIIRNDCQIEYYGPKVGRWQGADLWFQWCIFIIHGFISCLNAWAPISRCFYFSGFYGKKASQNLDWIVMTAIILAELIQTDRWFSNTEILEFRTFPPSQYYFLCTVNWECKDYTGTALVVSNLSAIATHRFFNFTAFTKKQNESVDFPNG